MQVTIYTIIAVATSVLGNAIAINWALQPDKISTFWFPLLLISAPLVFLVFGLLVAKNGLSLSSAIVDSVTTVSTILLGLFWFREVYSLTELNLLGLTLIGLGVILMQLNFNHKV